MGLSKQCYSYYLLYFQTKRLVIPHFQVTPLLSINIVKVFHNASFNLIRGNQHSQHPKKHKKQLETRKQQKAVGRFKTQDRKEPSMIANDEVGE